MDTETANHIAKPPKQTVIILIASFVLSVFWVVFVWNFWEQGIFALGGNASVFLLALLGLFVWIVRAKHCYVRKDLSWIVPLGMIAGSFALYDNPFLKATTLLCGPVLVMIFFGQAFLVDKQQHNWDAVFVTKLLGRFLSFVTMIKTTLSTYVHLIIPTQKPKKMIIARVVAGLALFGLIALTVFIPLLSSADAEFATTIGVVFAWWQKVASLPFIYKTIVVVLFSVVLSAVLLALSSRFEYTEKNINTKSIDPIVTGIVLGGILCLYVLFLWVQVSRLWVGSLPVDFAETESLVKSGFWQLLFLSCLNILIYFFTYKKTIIFVQRILAGFSIGSLLVLVSAGYRMGLYVVYYGLSYEKFFAAYAVVFCAVVFMWLIRRVFVDRRANILKFIVMLFMWMYALLVVTPVEQVIVRSNMSLSNVTDSRIRLFEMTMLSSDVLDLIKTYHEQGKLAEPVGYLVREQENKSQEQFDWTPWIEEQQQRIANKQWYEMNIMNALYFAKNN